MSIQWFPGHMAKAKREVTEKLKQIDVVIELVDARLPLSSRNPMIGEVVSDKPKLTVLNKADLADPEASQEWLTYFRRENNKAIAINAKSGKGVEDIPVQCRQLAQDMLQKRKQKGIRPRAVRALIVGIPNVGKSALINRLARKNIAKTGDRPGITKAQQWIKVGHSLELLDTPGILWPKFEDEKVGLRLAASGAIKDEILQVDDIALFALAFLKEHYPDRLHNRYQLEDIPEDTVSLLEVIGKKRGCLQKGGIIDYERASETVLQDLRGGFLGRITFEHPPKRS